jgi:competence protein ComEA
MTMLKKSVTVFMMLSVMVVFAANAYAVEKAAAKSATASGKLININTAGVERLVKLPRVGEKIAQRIIDYREKNGKFKKLEDLMKVSGIGEKTFKGFENMLTL